MMTNLPELFETWPAVYAVGSDYVITVPVTAESVMWACVGDRNFYDDSNGILRSASRTHRMTVPASLLDAAGAYTVCYRTVRERKPYFSDLSEVSRVSFSFRKLPEDNLHVYHVADAHNRIEGPVSAAKYFGDDLDLLVLNGDLPNHSGDIRNFTSIHRIAGDVTHGEIPVIFSRGNHDTRGIFAESLEYYTPTDGGRSYYTVRLGSLWAVVLDCGEDKTDDHAEYGNTVCCHDFRERETEFLRDVAAHPETEYAAPGVRYRLVICHMPFHDRQSEPFNIEEDLYTEWCRILKEKVRPDLMLCGHYHRCLVTLPGNPRDAFGQPCPTVIASSIRNDDKRYYVGGAVTLRGGKALVEFTDASGASLERQELILPGNTRGAEA